jgi:hypothetical protein
MQVRWCVRGLVALAVAVSVWAAAAAPALADGDPASDVLQYQAAFFPYAPASSSSKDELLGAIAAAKKAGLPIKVAVVQATQDLGADPELFAKPQLYARFLDSELLSTHDFGILIVVMPQGYGIAGGGKLIDNALKFKPRPIGKEQKALAELRPPHTIDPDTLVSAGVLAVRVVARAAGHPIPGKIPKFTPKSNPTTEGASGSGSSGLSGTAVELLAGLAVLALVAIAMFAVGIRKSRAPEPPA